MSTKRLRSVLRLAEEVDVFNANYPPGTKVQYTDDAGETHDTATRSVAWLVGGHTPVVLLENRTGGYLLDRVKPV